MTEILRNYWIMYENTCCITRIHSISSGIYRL